ncbi:MAG: 3-dehydroquinate synthase [Deltaproteobacteria bacterium]|nr:3-dehydroquinate synthase [Deltaproteobacteria bacterium]
MSLPSRIILSGFMGTGKTTVGKLLARKLDYDFVDTDDLVVSLSQKPIARIFAEEGEEMFRRWESMAIDQALAREATVIAVGGGAVCFRDNLDKIRKNGQLVLLKAQIPTLLKRLSADDSRPLLQGEDKEGQIREILAKRASAYSRISLQIPTDNQSPEAVVEEILRVLPLESRALRVELGERSYPLYFQKNGIESLNLLLQRHCPAERVVLVTNSVVQRLHGAKIARHLKRQHDLKAIVLPDGESFKTLKTVASVYAKLVEFKVDRKTPLIALGGGVIGDLVGFAAASFLRGIPFVQIPTTLLAQVDSSIGGKTGVDLPQGKNLVGAFYQPRFVLIDEAFLKTLKRREFVCGLAEVIKYAAIFDAKLFRGLEEHMEAILKGKGAGLEPVIRRCCELKAWVVERDEKETLGLRAKLNFGHTLGHAIESLTRYKKYTHGEAIAMGMVYAARRSVERAGLPEADVERLKALIARAGLPTEMPAFPKAAYRKALMQDKKRVSSRLHFVYLNKIGKSVVIPTPLDEILV